MSTQPGPNKSQMDQAKDSARQALVPSLVGGSTEIAPTAGAAQVQAMVQARFIMALKQPRTMDQVRQDLLKECRRPSFALEEIEGEGNSALYRRPVGNGKIAEGLGIRFAEVAELCMGNLMAGALTISEDERKKTKYCFVVDLQTNNSWEDTIDISKTVERANPKQGDEIISSRTNSRGTLVHTIAASEDSLVTKEGAMVSKKLRTLILRLIPGHIQDECIAAIKEVRAKRITDDPDAAKNRIIDGMALQNITVTQLEDYLGHPVGQCSPVEILNLQGLYGAIRDGITTWKDVMDNIEESRKIKPVGTQPQATETPTAGMAGAKAAQEPVPQPVQQPAQPTVQPQPTQPIQQAPAPQQPVTQAVPAQTAAEIPPVAQQQAQAPVQQPAAAPVEAPPAQPQPQPPPAPVELVGNLAQTYQPPPAAAAPPAWATEAAVPAQQPVQPQAPVVEQQPQAPVQQAAGLDPMPGGLGKLIKDVQFPARMTKSSEGEAVTQDQLNRAQSELEKLNARLGKAFKLESTVKNWFQVELSQLNTQTMECIITVLANWK